MENLLKNISNYFLSVILILILPSCQNDLSIDCENCYAISNTNIIDVENGQVNSNMTLIIKDNYIFEIGKIARLKINEKIPMIDGTDQYVIPGLWDMHTHLSTEYNTKNIFFPLFIGNGVTGIRVMASDCFEPCWELDMNIAQSRKLQEEVKKGSILGPKTVLASTYINGALEGESSVQIPLTEIHGRELVQLLKSRGVDFIKIYDELTPMSFIGIADEANKLGIDFAGHVPVSVKTSEASNYGQKSIEHCCEGNLFNECTEIEDEMRKKIIELIRNGEVANLNELTLEMIEAFDSAKCQKIYELFKENNTWFVPTLRLVEIYYPNAKSWKDNINIKYLPKDEMDFYIENEEIIKNLYGPINLKIEEKRRQIVNEMNRAGVGLLAGSDCGETGVIHGFSLHEELESMVNAGLSELEALQTATINPALYQEATDSLGTIASGKIADLVLLDNNPLENISNVKKISAVIANGKYYNRIALDSLLKTVELRAIDTYK